VFLRLVFSIFLFFLINFSFLNCSNNVADCCSKDFIESFVKHYEFNVEGRYTHEYHPFLLSNTSYSLDELENSLKNEGFNLFGRIIICGYEEQAVPTYYTDYKKPKINDEASFKSKVGWSLKLHNKFGFMTGFLFKDVNFFNDHWFAGKEPLFEHINPEKIEIFQDDADIFQEHAFGQTFDLILQMLPSVLGQVKKENMRNVFKELLIFWQTLYENALKANGKQIAGTSDIFFSIEYAKHLIRSSMSFLKFYTGPDITYPIEVSLKQEKGATANAQDFVKKFTQNLIARDGKPTAYIFCSFVDGVGKSTLLGNVKNKLKYGDDVEMFGRVDNSSSQLAEVFKVKEGVFIADLPAQVSHFTYKPDGLVYVSAERELEEGLIEKVKTYVRKNKDSFFAKYKESLVSVEREIKEAGFFSPQLNADRGVEKAFIKNLFLLKKNESNLWIPFDYEVKNYLFNLNDFSQIRVLQPLGKVQSEGLKNIESEQMLFFDGVRFPLLYPLFLNDLTTKLKKAGVENIVFVDFISMYPRSSRENIRINYLLQQIALQDKSFDPKFSLYRNFVNGAELLYLLTQKESLQAIVKGFEVEALTRVAMYRLIVERGVQDINGISLQQLTTMISQEFENFSSQDLSFTKDFIAKKVMLESLNLQRLYGDTKSFINIHMLSFKDIYDFSEHLSQFLSDRGFIEDENLRNLWEYPNGCVSAEQLIKSDGMCHQLVQLNSQEKFYALHAFNKNCKDENILSPFLKNLRAAWYAVLSNLIFAGGENEDLVTVFKEKYLVPSFVVKKDQNARFYLIQKLFEQWEEENLQEFEKTEKLFNLTQSCGSSWGRFGQNVYRLDFKSQATNCGVFAFDCDLNSTKKILSQKSVVTYLVQKHQKVNGSDIVMPTSKLYKMLKKSELWKKESRALVEQAKKNGLKREQKKQGQEANKKNGDKNAKNQTTKNNLGLWSNPIGIKVYLGNEKQKGAIRLFIRFIATLEMVLKDPEADIVVRKGSKKDFKAALKLLEKVTLPKYYGILFEKSLFDDYDKVEPVIHIELR